MFLLSQKSETLVHLFYEYEVVQNLWDEVWRYWEECFQIYQNNFTSTAVILNKIMDKPGHIVNFLCLVTKQYIYSSRCLKQGIHIVGLRRVFKQIENVEKYIATKNGKLTRHMVKWMCNEVSVLDQSDVHLDNYVMNYLNERIV